MKKILISVITILAVTTATIGATQALFTDEEVSTGNTFTAGTLDLTVDGKNGDEVATRYTITNWKPGDSRNVGQIKVKNVGSVNGKYWIEIKNVVNHENGCIEPESDDTTCGDTEGELGSKVSGYFQENISPWSHINPAFSSINAAEGIRMETATGTLDAGEERPFVLYAKWLPTDTDNLAQGDTVSFDIVFHLEQAN